MGSMGVVSVYVVPAEGWGVPLSRREGNEKKVAERTWRKDQNLQGRQKELPGGRKEAKTGLATYPRGGRDMGKSM